jgi:hypothetical protein
VFARQLFRNRSNVALGIGGCDAVFQPAEGSQPVELAPLHLLECRSERNQQFGIPKHEIARKHADDRV